VLHTGLIPGWLRGKESKRDLLAGIKPVIKKSQQGGREKGKKKRREASKKERRRTWNEGRIKGKSHAEGDYDQPLIN